MSFCLKKLPKEETIREIAEKFGNLEPKHIEGFVILSKFIADYERALEEHYKKFDLSDGRFMVLISIKRSPERLKATDIANELGVSRATMTGLVDSLLRDELISKSDCKEDRRISYLHLTEKAEAHLDKMFPTHFKTISNFMSCLNNTEIDELKNIATKLQQNLTTFLNA